jgi:photosystem II stability/assembly factor-like uncharacterized protein
LKISKIAITVITLMLAISSVSSQWSQIANIPVSKISSIKFFNENVGFACGGGVWKTTNGGYNWTQIFTAGANSFCFLDTMNGFVSGNPARIYKTTNGGINWDTTVLTSGFSGVDAIGFFNVNTGISVGFNGIINRTSNSGINWYRHDTIYFQEQLAVSLLPSGNGWIAGGAPYELIKKVANFGTSWSYQSPGAIGGLNGVYSLNDNITYVCGHQGVIRRTTNGGGNWTKLDSLTSRSLKAVYFSNSTSGNVVGDIGTILRTTNSGANWFVQSSPTSNGLLSVFYINNETGWIGGNNGVLLKTTNGGGITAVNEVSNGVPAQYELFQNYPNPFNPNTIIKFSLLEEGEVTLTIYSTTGEEVWRYTNNKLNHGTYEIKWNAESYASGVYYYTMKTDDILLTKKMILIK